jgi:hypothetical protein
MVDKSLTACYALGGYDCWQGVAVIKRGSRTSDWPSMYLPMLEREMYPAGRRSGIWQKEFRVYLYLFFFLEFAFSFLYRNAMDRGKPAVYLMQHSDLIQAQGPQEFRLRLKSGSRCFTHCSTQRRWSRGPALGSRCLMGVDWTHLEALRVLRNGN